MARKPRKESSLQIYHVILRGNNKQSIFFDDNDRDFFINRIYKYSDQLDIHIYSYCLMENHVHILLGNAPKANLSLFVQKLANSYVYYFNHKYDCCGHLFQGRFKSEPVEDEIYLKNVLRYILNNPAKANICEMKDYKWSSYKELTNLLIKTKLKRDFILSLFGSDMVLKQFLLLSDNNIYMDYENKQYFNDRMVKNYIKSLINGKNIASIKSLPQKELLDILKELKTYKFSISQLSRITGIPRRIIINA